jgi:hypothetical protein
MTRRGVSSVGVFAVALALATVAHAQPRVVVHGDTTCPSVDMILAALPSARPDAAWLEQTVDVEVADDRLALRLGEAPGVRREIPADGDCSVRAESVAVVLAVWAGELAARPTDSPELTIASPAPVFTPTKKPSHVIELDGAAFYSPVWGHGPGASLGVGRTPREGGVGVRVLGAYQSARDVALEGGTNQVLRFLVGAALTYQLQRRHVFAAGDVGLVGTLTRAQGAGYETNQAGYAANFGGVADLRGGLRLGRFSLWLNARGLRLVHAETLKINSTSPGVADSATLSAWDVQLGIGLGFRFE